MNSGNLAWMANVNRKSFETTDQNFHVFLNSIPELEEQNNIQLVAAHSIGDRKQPGKPRPIIFRTQQMLGHWKKKTGKPNLRGLRNFRYITKKITLKRANKIKGIM